MIQIGMRPPRYSVAIHLVTQSTKNTVAQVDQKTRALERHIIAVSSIHSSPAYDTHVHVDGGHLGLRQA